MVKVNGTTVTMTRGDTFTATLTLKDASGNLYEPVSGDAIRFAAKQTYSDCVPKIIKVIPNEDLTLTLDPADTKKLKFGTYVYDIQITFADGRVDTVIDRGKLIITEEVD